jgi:uncharacterized membrane protein
MAFSHILVGAGTKPTHPVVRHLMQSLTRGYNDFSAMPSHAVFLCVIYPLLGLLLIAMTLGYSMSLAFPLAAGFALIGPLAAIGLYELSRRREAGFDCSAGHVLDLLHSPSLAAIVALGLLLMTIFLIWLAVAEAIYVANFGYGAPTSIPQFVDDLFNTSAGWNLIGTVFVIDHKNEQAHGRLPDLASDAATRGRIILNSVNSPGSVSTSIDPPCCLTTMS